MRITLISVKEVASNKGIFECQLEHPGFGIIPNSADTSVPSCFETLKLIFEVPSGVAFKDIDFSTLPYKSKVTVEPYIPPTLAEELAELTLVKQTEVRQAFKLDLSSNSVFVSGVDWDCKATSATMLNGAIQNAEFKGDTHVGFFDSSNTVHVLTILEAKVVASGVADEFIARLVKKQTALTAIGTATTVAELQATGY